MNRFCSRRQRLDHAFLSKKFAGAKAYRRIEGCFRSSIFDLVGEEIAGIPKVQIICHSELDAADVVVSKHVRDTALKERWNEAAGLLERVAVEVHPDPQRPDSAYPGIPFDGLGLALSLTWTVQKRDWKKC